MRQCRQCHNQSERERRAKSRLKSDRKQVGSFLTELKNEGSNDRVQMLCNRMFRQFGGFQGFVDAWTDYQQKAIESGGFPAFRCFAAMFRLLEYCSESESEVGQLTDEELEQELAKYANNTPDDRTCQCSNLKYKNQLDCKSGLPEQ